LVLSVVPARSNWIGPTAQARIAASMAASGVLAAARFGISSARLSFS
jgi:hypothetical protein